MRHRRLRLHAPGSAGVLDGLFARRNGGVCGVGDVLIWGTRAKTVGDWGWAWQVAVMLWAVGMVDVRHELSERVCVRRVGGMDFGSWWKDGVG